MDMKVFKMNDYNHVCAESEELAKEFYIKKTGIEICDMEDDFVGEVSLENTMFTTIDSLQEEDLEEPQLLTRWYGEIWVVKPFSWVIKNEKITSSRIICSTEY